MAGLGKVYSTHSVVPLRGHQSKNESGSPEERGSSPSLIARGFFLPEVVTLLLVASVGQGSGRAADSPFGIQTTISPRPRLAQAWYGMAVSSASLRVTRPWES